MCFLLTTRGLVSHLVLYAAEAVGVTEAEELEVALRDRLQWPCGLMSEEVVEVGLRE